MSEFLHTAVRRVAAELAPPGRPVNESEIARRLGLSRGRVNYVIRQLRAVGMWDRPADRGIGRRKFAVADRALVVRLARGPVRPSVPEVVRRFRAATGRPIGNTTVDEILGSGRVETRR
jgi:hypothetical protein